MDIYTKLQIEEELKNQMEKETFDLLEELTKDVKIEYYTKTFKREVKNV